MRKIRKRVFAAVLAAALLFTMPGMASYAEAETAQTEDISESVTVQTEDDAAEETGAETEAEVMQESEAEDCDTDKPGIREDDTGDTETDEKEPAEEETVPVQKEDVKECICGTLCTQDSINGDCPVCGAEDADLSRCKGEKTENSSEENKEDAGQEDTGEQDDSANLCAHHKEHTKDCGYSRASEDGEGNLCTYECRICPIEALIAALPRALTEDNAETVRWQLDEILDLWRELSEDEQGQIDMTLCSDLLAALDEANAPAPVEGEVSAAYQEASWDGSAVTYTDKTENCTPVTDSTEAVTWNTGWYVVNSTVTISQPITVNGDVNLILADGCTLNAEQGIVVTENNSLTIYAQSGGTGTLNATGKYYDTSDAATSGVSAGIGGSVGNLNSGKVTIHGGVIHATGGGMAGNCGAAGIGGGTPYSGDGGDSGAIKIYGGAVTAKSGEGAITGAGIGGGAGSQGKGGNTSSITIYGGDVIAESNSTQTGGAGIGGGAAGSTGGSGSNITISGGIVTANGGSLGAGIGGGGCGIGGTSGAGTNITISGGVVTAVGGRYAAGIGGGGGYKIGNYTVTGGTSTGISITGSIVDAQGGAGNSSGYEGEPIGNGGNAIGDAGVTRTAGIIFEGGVGKVYGNVELNKNYAVPANYSLTISTGASLSGSGTLSGGSEYLIEGLTAAMISVPEGWRYTGEDLSEQIKGAVSLSGDTIICGQTFHADTTGWELSVARVSDLKYTVTYTHTDGQAVSKDVTIAQAQTTLTNVETYRANGTSYASSFSMGDTFVVKATPVFPANNAIMVADFMEPTGEQMAVYYDGRQISEPSTVDANGVHTMTVNTNDFPPEALNKEITLTVKYIESDNASGADAETKVKITAVAQVETGGVTTYYGRFGDAWTAAKGGESIVTLLANVSVIKSLNVSNGDNITFNGGTHSLAIESGFTMTGGELTITGGTVTVTQGNNGVSLAGGKLTVTGGTIETKRSEGVGINVFDSSGTVRISGNAVIKGQKYGVECDSGTADIKISGGTITGSENAVILGLTWNRSVSELLENYGGTTGTHYAFYQNGIPVTSGLDSRTLPGGTYTVEECDHTAEGVVQYEHIDSTQTHTLTCLACGYTEGAADCSYGTEYQHDDTDHWQTCTACGYENKVAHNWTFTGDSIGDGSVTENYQLCLTCLRTKDHLTLTITVPDGLTYGNTEGKKVTYTLSPETVCDKVTWTFIDGDRSEFAGGVLPANLPVGEHWFRVEGFMSDETVVFSGPYYLTVSAAPLTGNMVTLSPESVTYSGAEQKPTITVKQGNTTLKEGTDYDVAYSTTDFTNAGTITVTITGKGNYTGTVETTYTIKKAPLTITASNQTITYGGSITQGADNVTVAGLCTGDILESITLTASTANVPGGNITPSAAGIKNSGGDVTGNYEITYKNGGLTINKADAEITVGTDTYNKTFGDAAFTLDVTDNNTEADVQYEVTAGADVISVSNGTVTIQNAGTAAITVSLPETANYNAAASKTITVTVAKKGGYTVAEMNRSYLYSRGNTDSINLAALLPKDCGNVTYGTPAASGDVTYSVVPAVSDGKLSYTLNSGEINAEGTITITVATHNYTDITITVKVKLTDQIPVSLKTGTEVTLENNVLTYGEPLSKLEFNKAEFVDDDGKTVLGTLAWKDAAATPNAGTTGATWVFTPNNEEYAPVEGTAAITVNKAVPAVSAAPTVAGRVYDPSITLKDDKLSGATVTGVGGNTLEGTWSWQSANIVPTVNNSGYVAVFTPKDTTNYETVTRTITVTVTKATPYIAELPAAAAVTYGETLKDSLLSGGTVVYGNGAGQEGDKAGSTETVAGAFTWKEPSTKPVAADSNVTEFAVVFTPSDTANYNPVEAAVKLTVNKAQNAPNMPGSAMSVSNSIEKVGSVPLPAGWEWQALDKDTALEAGVAVSAVAVYTGADKGNYENETVTVAITRSSCDHVAGDVLYTGEGEKAPTCTEDGLGHKECTVCGAVMESGIVVEALKHTGGTATCSKRAVCTRCNQPYGDTDSNIHGGTEVRGFVEATCTAGGYTGDTYCKDCGAKTGAGNATPALGHDYKGRVTREPTTEREGERTYTCTRCGDSYKESIPRLPEETHGHSYTDRVTKEPTCTDTGVRTYTCTCGDSYTETIAALGHHYLGSETKKPTTTAEGVMTYTCDRCGHSYTRPIAKLPGDDTTKPGSGQPGDTEPGSGNTEETRPEPGMPFIKGEDGKVGWEVIRAEEEQAKEGSIINVDMNGTTVVPGDIFDSIKGRDITITFDMGGGIIWSVDGKSVTADRTGDIDFDLKTGVNAIPVDIVNNVTGERYSIQISLAHEGEFGFTAVLSINLGKENAGYTASLYYYNQSTGELEFICADEVAEDGTASLAFTHASDYVIAIDGDEEESSITEPAQPEGTEGADGNSTAAEESPKTGQRHIAIYIIALIAVVIAIAGIAVFVWRKKEEKEGDG